MSGEVEVECFHVNLEGVRFLEVEEKGVRRSVLRDENFPTTLIQSEWTYKRSRIPVNMVSCIDQFPHLSSVCIKVPNESHTYVVPRPSLSTPGTVLRRRCVTIIPVQI